MAKRKMTNVLFLDLLFVALVIISTVANELATAMFAYRVFRIIQNKRSPTLVRTFSSFLAFTSQQHKFEIKMVRFTASRKLIAIVVCLLLIILHNNVTANTDDPLDNEPDYSHNDKPFSGTILRVLVVNVISIIFSYSSLNRRWSPYLLSLYAVPSFDDN